VCSDVSKFLRHIPRFFFLSIRVQPVCIKELETYNCITITYFQNFENGRIETWREITNLGIEFFKIVVDVILCFSGREA
jgi:hypothetical protein